MSLIEKNSPVRVDVRKLGDRYSLFRDGKPFFVKGAGGFEHLDRLAASGGNAIRTWGSEQTEQALPELSRHKLTLCAGLWLEPPRRGFDYSDEAAVARQFACMKEQVDRLKDIPELLIWGVGNELELSSDADENVWRAVESVAAYIKSVDTRHPVMSVLASPQDGVLQAIDRFCPSLDFVGINSYGDIGKVASRLQQANWNRPYLITEWGADGSWEVPVTSWGAEIEPTSTEKASQVRERYRRLLDHDGLCLGGFVFLWGSKQERTHTWFSLLSEEGLATESVEALSAIWRDVPETQNAPQISPLRLNDRLAIEECWLFPGERVSAAVEVLRGSLRMSDVQWRIGRESEDKKEGGDPEEAPETLELGMERLSAGTIRFEAPKRPGGYRLYFEARGTGGYYATANFPFFVKPAKG